MHLVTSLGHLAVLRLRGKKEPSEKDVVDLLLNTGLVLFVQAEETPNGFDLHFKIDNFALHCFDVRTDHSLEVKAVSSEGHTAVRIAEFLYDGKPIRSNKDRLVICNMMVGLVVHPLVHSMANSVYASHNAPGAEQFDEIFRHCQYLNNIAHTRTGEFLRLPTTQESRQSFEHNAVKPIPFHSHKSLEKLQGIAPYINFCLKARVAVFRLVRQHKVPVDAEVCSPSGVLYPR